MTDHGIHWPVLFIVAVISFNLLAIHKCTQVVRLVGVESSPSFTDTFVTFICLHGNAGENLSCAEAGTV